MFVTRTTAALLAASMLSLTGAAPAPVPDRVPAAAADTDTTQASVVNDWGRVVSGDEFSYTGPPDPAKWKVYDGVGHGGNGIRSPQAWSVADGVATVGGDAAGTTGGMSARFGERKYGRWEARVRTSARDSQYHPALILWPNNNKSPNCAEIDYAEGTSDRTLIKFFLHYACTTSSFQTEATAPVDTTQWHNYAVQWTRAGITGYIDGVPWFTDTDPTHQPTVRMHQTIQLDWFPNGAPTTPTQMQVDWIRVYQ
jgi:beta-glucanase (GH16 family)